jgi:hypothetical protein
MILAKGLLENINDLSKLISHYEDIYDIHISGKKFWILGVLKSDDLRKDINISVKKMTIIESSDRFFYTLSDHKFLGNRITDSFYYQNSGVIYRDNMNTPKNVENMKKYFKVLVKNCNNMKNVEEIYTFMKNIFH